MIKIKLIYIYIFCISYILYRYHLILFYFSDMHYIVEVTVPESEFKIRFRSLRVTKSQQIRGDVVVDGKIDETCVEMYDRSFQVVTGFWNQKTYESFKFPSNLWSSMSTPSDIS